MLSNFYWIIENELAGMSMPTAARAYLYLDDADLAAKEEMEREFEELGRYGIHAVVTLTENPLSKQALKEAGFEYLHLPVPDMTAPTQSQIQEFIEFTCRHLEAGKAVVVHCLGGSGRTGTMLACYLVYKGYPPREAIRAVRNRRPGAIETHWQEEAIEEYSWSLMNRDM